MKVNYYPGCSLKNSYPEFEKSAKAVCDVIGVELEEIPEWNCCGVNFSLSDNIMKHLGAVRTFINTQEEGKGEKGRILTLCSMCFNVLKRVNQTLKEERDTLENINDFIEDQPNYKATLDIQHFLPFLQNTIGFDALAEKVSTSLEKFRIAPYYGCALLRPSEVSVDTAENPKILEKLIKTMGASPIQYPFKIECCGNYHTAFREEIVKTRSKKIVKSALSSGANMIISPCPLCTYNLRLGKKALGKEIPIVFFTQALAIALDTKPYLSPSIKKEGIMKSFTEASHV